MDTLTHIAIGACIGDLFAGKKLGKRAMFLGAVLQSIPDIDFVASFWLDPVSDLLSHRGFTHSILFAVLVTPLLAWFAAHIHAKHNLSMTRWLWFFGTEIAVHLFLDAFNAYGTGWWEPFNHARISFHAIFVADPLFSILPGVAFLALLILRSDNPNRKYYFYFVICFVCAYLLFVIGSKEKVDKSVRQIAHQQNIKYDRYFITPTPLNSLLWFAVLESDSGFYTGYRSLFDTRPDMTFTYFPQNEHLAAYDKYPIDVEKLKRFSQGYYTLEMWNDTLVFSDLRFGQMIGWNDPGAHFAFHYFLNLDDDNELVIQRGRFANWNRAAFRGLINRIGGD